VSDPVTGKNPSEMSDDEYSTWVAERMMQGWVPLAHYQRMYPDETQAKVDMRVARGDWVRGVHYSAPAGSRAWVNLIAIREWLEDTGLLDEALRRRRTRTKKPTSPASGSKTE
jgi:hypothetical protein